MKLVKTADKPARQLRSAPICPVEVGCPAVLAMGGKLIHTSEVIAIHSDTRDYLHFETHHAHYHLNRKQIQFAAIHPLLLSMAA